MSLFQQLHLEGITIVLVTHEPEIARFAHRILRFRDGIIVGDENVTTSYDTKQDITNESSEKEEVR